MERILADLHVFVAMSETINSTLGLRQVLQAVTDAGTTLSGARFGAFFYNAVDDEQRSYRFHVLSGADADAFTKMPAPRITRLFEPTFSGEGTVRIDDVVTDPRTNGMPKGHVPLRSYLATPVVSRSGEVIGALLFGHPDSGVFDQRSEDVVRLVASQAAVAVENARLFEAEKRARVEAEQSVQRLALLQGITARLANAFTSEDALTAVAEVVGPLGASRVGVYVAARDGWEAVAGADRDGRGPQETQLQLLPYAMPTPVSTAADTRSPDLFSSPEELVRRYPELAAAIPEVGAAVALPLTFGNTVSGVLVLAWGAARSFASGEVEMLSAAAGQLAAALERARLFQAEQEGQQLLKASAAEAIKVSQTLQRSLLPPTLPTVDAVSVAVRYEPGEAGAEVGGDWYDIITAPDGKPVFVVGDVEGHSLGASAVMGQLRIALHAYLAEGHDPSVAVARVNRLMMSLDAPVLATCCLVEVDPVSGQARIVRAGHPPPLLRKADGSVTELETDGGLPLGVDPESEWPTTELTLETGDRLMLYTDGLVDRPGQATDGMASLMAAAASVGPTDTDTDTDIDADIDAILAGVGGHRTDDAALLVCDYAGPAGDEERVCLDIGAISEVGDARTFTRDALRLWQMAPLEESLTLLVSEMVTNALIHTDGAATLELRRDRGRVRVMVTDTHTRVPRPQEENIEATGGRGVMLVEVLADAWGVEPSGSGKTVWADVSAG